MATFTLGLLGAGRWGERYISTINELPGVEIRHLYTTHPKKARLIQNRVRVFSDWHELIQSADCDAVIVATPPHTHPAILRDCIAAHKAVLVEKPLCLSADEALALHMQVEGAQAPVLVGHTQLFNGAYEKLLELARDRGAIRFIISQGAGFGPFRSDTPPLWDWCPHDVAWCLDLMSQMPAHVSALGASPGPHPGSGAEMMALRLDFHSTTQAWILAGSLSPVRMRSLSVQFADSVLFLKDDETGSSLFSYDVAFDERNRSPSTFRLPAAETVAVGSERPLTRQVKYFVDGLKGGDKRRFGLRLAVDVVRTLERAQHALDRQLETQ